MNILNFVWLGSGFGLGWLASWLWSRKSAPSDEREIPSDAHRLQELELACRSAIEMSQFKSGFLARTSHELRSPLNGMIGAQQLVLSDLCESPEEEREFIAQSNESALKMVRLLDEIIHVSKAEAGTGKLDLEPLSLEGVLENIFSLTYLLAANRNLKFDIAFPEPDIWVLADRRSLEQVLTSLISSAIATMQTGKLSVSVRASEQFAQIILEDERPIEAWQETLDLLKNPPDHSSDPLVALNQEPSLSFSLLLSQNLLEQMHGKLELLSVPNQPDETVTRLQCVLPRVTLE
jgi:hypothetical protein